MEKRLDTTPGAPVRAPFPHPGPPPSRLVHPPRRTGSKGGAVHRALPRRDEGGHVHGLTRAGCALSVTGAMTPAVRGERAMRNAPGSMDRSPLARRRRLLPEAQELLAGRGQVALEREDIADTGRWQGMVGERVVHRQA